MKKLLLFCAISFLLSSCGSTNWEYKIVSVEGKESEKYSPREISVSNEDLNLFGKEGWELVDIYTITETVHPNFGDEKYVTGLQPNTRTSKVNFVFKRKM